MRKMRFAVGMFAVAGSANARVTRVALGKILNESALLCHFLRHNGLRIRGDDLIHESQHASMISAAAIESELGALPLLFFHCG
ncbi:MAG: hypothetical protein RL117_715 [Verrucomicrobiota bacterium]